MHTKTINHYNEGPFHLAKSAGVDIVPAVIIGANRLYPPKSPFPGAGTPLYKYKCFN